MTSSSPAANSHDLSIDGRVSYSLVLTVESADPGQRGARNAESAPATCDGSVRSRPDIATPPRGYPGYQTMRGSSASRS
jgi:hypothetical protein